MRRLIIPNLLLVLIGALFACGESSNVGTAVTPSSAPSQPTQKAAQHFKLGETVHVDVWQIVITSASTSSGSQFMKPAKPDHLFLIVAMTVKNISAQEQTISSLAQFHLEDKSGQRYDYAIFPDAGQTVDGKVEAGSPRKGVIVWDIPNMAHDFLLSFEANLAAPGQVVWEIKV